MKENNDIGLVSSKRENFVIINNYRERERTKLGPRNQTRVRLEGEAETKHWSIKASKAIDTSYSSASKSDV